MMIWKPFKASLWQTLLLLLSGAVFLTSPLLAQDEEIDFSEMSLEDLLNVEVTVASKSEETVADAPSSVTVFTRAEIQNMGITTLEELLNYVPGFQSQKQVSYGQSWTVQVRGKPENGFISKEHLLLKDGQRLNDAYTGGSSSINRLTTLDDVKQIEIIRGPGSALYGSNAFLGVINIVTVDDHNSASIRGGTYENRDVSANFSRSGGDWSVSGFVRAFEDNGQEYFVERDFFGRSGITDDPRQGSDVSAKIKYKNFRLVAGHTQRDLPNYMGGLAIGGDNINSNIEKQSRINATYEAKPNDRFNLTANLGYLTGSDLLIWHWPNLFGPDVALDFGAYWEVENKNFNLDMAYALNDVHNFSFGASYEERGVTDNAAISRVDNVITFNRGAFGITSNVIRDVVAIYLQDQMKFGENLKLTLGIRYDDYSDFGDTTNPRGALIYSTPFKGKFKLMYGQAFRAPSNSELFTINSLAAWGNTELQPEQVKTFEVAYNQSLEKVNFTLTYFDNTFTDNIITTANPAPPPDVIFVNQDGETESSGFEFEFTASPVKGFFIRGSYTASDNNDEWSPENYGSLILNYNSEKWNFNLHSTWHDEVDKVPGQGTVSILNTSFKYNIFEKTSLQFTAINLTDENSLSPDAPFTDDGLVVERRGRTLTLAVNFDF